MFDLYFPPLKNDRCFGNLSTEDLKDKSIADIMFVVDCTASMSSELEAIKDTIKDIANTACASDKRVRLGLIEFRNRQIGQEHYIHSFENCTDTFTQFPDLFNREVDKLQAEGGRGYHSSSLDAILLALRQPFTSEAKKVIVLFTDASPSIPDVEAKSVEQVAQAISDAGVEIYIVKKTLWSVELKDVDTYIISVNNVYTQLVECTEGKVFELGLRYNLRNFSEELKSNLREWMNTDPDKSYFHLSIGSIFGDTFHVIDINGHVIGINGHVIGINGKAVVEKSDYELGREQGYSDSKYDCTSQISDKLLFKSRDYQNGYVRGFENGKIIATALAYIKLDEFHIYGYKSQKTKNNNNLWYALSHILRSSNNYHYHNRYKNGEFAMNIASLTLASLTLALLTWAANPNLSYQQILTNSQSLKTAANKKQKLADKLGKEANDLLQEQQKYINLANSINPQRWQVVGYKSRISGSNREIWGWGQDPQLIQQKNQYLWQADIAVKNSQNLQQLAQQAEQQATDLNNYAQFLKDRKNNWSIREAFVEEAKKVLDSLQKQQQKTVMFIDSTGVGKSSSYFSVFSSLFDYELGRKQGYLDGRYKLASQIWDKLLFKSKEYQDGYERGFENRKIIATALSYITLDEFHIYEHKDQKYKNNNSFWYTLFNISGSSSNYQKKYSKYREYIMNFVNYWNTYYCDDKDVIVFDEADSILSPRLSNAENSSITEASSTANFSFNLPQPQKESNIMVSRLWRNLMRERFLQNKKVFDFVLQLSWCEPRIRKRNKSTIKFA